MAAVAVLYVINREGSVEAANIAAWNAVCRYVEMEADDTLVATPAAASSNGTLLAVPPTPHPDEKQYFSDINQKRLMEYSGRGLYANSESKKLHCLCNGKPLATKTASNLKNHLKSKGHEKYETVRLNDTERKRLTDARDVYLQKHKSYKNMHCLDGMTTCKDCYLIVSKDTRGKKHAGKYSCTLCA